jgi:integrase
MIVEDRGRNVPRRVGDAGASARGVDGAAGGRWRRELADFLYTAERILPIHAALAMLLGLNGLRVNEACGVKVEDLGFERRHRPRRIVGKGNKPSIHDPAGAAHPPHPRSGHRARTAGPILRRHGGSTARPAPAHRWVQSIGRRAGLAHVHPHMVRAAFINGRPRRRLPLRDVQLAARHADPRTATIYDRRRQNFDRHAAYAVVAFVTSG